MSVVSAPAALEGSAAVEVALLSALVNGATGAVVANSGKRKWVFVFLGGDLVESRSNLKSEHPDTIRAKKPSMSDAAVVRNCAMLRMRNAIKNDATWSWSAGAEAKEPTKIKAMGLLFRAVAGQRSADEVRVRIGLTDEAVLQVGADLTGMELPRELSAVPKGWAGGSVADALSGGAGTAAERATALWVGWALGVVSSDEGTASDTETASASGAGNTLDIGALLDGLGSGSAGSPSEDTAEATESSAQNRAESDARADASAGEKNWVPDKVLLPPEGASGPGRPTAGQPDGFEEAEIEAIGDDGPVKLDASFFEALNQRPDRETVRSQGFVHSSHDAPEPEPKHPLEDDLRALAERIASSPDFFGVLDVPYDSAPEVFRKAHLQLAQKLHPDRFSDASDELQDLATETFDKVREAWEVLGDEEKRGAYVDRVIHGKKTEDELAMEQVENYWAAEADFKRGLAAFNAGRVREAHELFKSAVDREGGELEFRAYLGFTTFQLHKSSDPDAAEVGKEMLKEVLEKNKEQERKLDAAWVLMGRVFRDQGNDKGARRCFVQALKINTANGDAQREMRRLSGNAGPARKAQAESKEKKSGGFFSRWFGKK